MQKKKYPQAFTLVELLAIIAIIGILSFAISGLNFSRLSLKEKVLIETSKIVSILEETRNNALIGRARGVDFISPESWRVIISNSSSSGSIRSEYMSGGVFESYNTWDFQTPASLLEIQCANLDTTDTDVSNSVEISFTGSKIAINSGCSSVANPKIINMQYGTPDIFESISINTLSGVIGRN